MMTFITSARAEEIHSLLSGLRSRYSSEPAASVRLEIGTEVVRLYGELALVDRAADWAEATAPLADTEGAGTLQYRYHLATALVWIEREDAQAVHRCWERLKGWPAPTVEDELASLSIAVRAQLLCETPEPFAPLERAFRLLRQHPSALWSSRFLMDKARWLQGLKRDEAAPTLKKALSFAEEAGDIDAQLRCLLFLAEGFGPRVKAERYAKAALEKAREWDVPLAVAQALGVMSRLTGSKETPASLAFRDYADRTAAVEQQTRQWDRQARDADHRLFEATGRGRRLQEAQALASVTSALASEPVLSRSLDHLYASVKALMVADVFGIALWVPDQAALDYALFIEEGRRTRVGLIPVESTRSLGAWCFRERTALRIHDIDKEYGRYLKELSKLSDHRSKSMLFQPLLADGSTLGIVTVQSFSRDSYGPEDEAHLAILAATIALRLQVGGRSEG